VKPGRDHNYIMNKQTEKSAKSEKPASLLEKVLANALRGQGASSAEISQLLEETSSTDFQQAAGEVRRKHFGREVRCCSILSVRSGHCSEDCSFCAQSGHHNSSITPTELLDTEAILQAVRQAREDGAEGFGLVSSGCGPLADNVDDFCVRLQALGREGLSVHASLGVLDDYLAGRLAEAGVKVYNHNLETARSFFGQVCTTHSYDQRIATLEALGRTGIERCCGGIFGLGESWEQRLELAGELSKLKIERVPINFLVPIKGTPLEDRPLLDVDEALSIVAAFRLMLPKSWIQVCGGRELVLGARQAEIFDAGATGMIIGNYLTIKGRSASEDLKMIRELGLELIT
jgi:biotin synthase